MSTIEDKLLDGPRVHYCDADNDDIRRGDDQDEEEMSESCSIERGDASSLFQRPPDGDENGIENCLAQARFRSSGSSTNTGPKGVIQDFKKRSLSRSDTLQSHNEVDSIEAEFQELLHDESTLNHYISRRLAENKKLQSSLPTFGQVYHLRSGGELLDAIDKENPNVLVIVHIYTKYSKSCANLNRCLNELSADLKNIKFVTLDASVTALSSTFKENGVPALLAYKKGDLLKSLVQLEELLDRNFEAYQVKELLSDNGLI